MFRKRKKKWFFVLHASELCAFLQNVKVLHLIHSSLFLKEMFGERQLRLSLDPQEDSFVFIPLSFVVSKIEIENRIFKEKIVLIIICIYASLS